jgi:hypothetical protein
MQGGFVSRNCPKCNIPGSLPEAAFRGLALWVACPGCKNRMAATILPDKNYGYACARCDLGIPLFALLPKWEDL